MLTEDIDNAIIPYCSGPKKYFLITLTNGTKDTEELITSAISHRDYYRDFTDVVAECIRRCANEVMYFGKSEYEIVYYYGDQDKNNIVSFELSHIPNNSIRCSWRKIFQVIPADVAEERHVPTSIELDPERIFVFTLPKSIQKNWPRIIESLSDLSDLLLPDFAMPDPRNSRNIPFDSSYHYLMREQALAKAAKGIGWNARYSYSENVLEFYTLYRFLKFEKFKIEFRDHLFEQLNSILAKVGKEIGFSCQLEVEGLPTLKDVQQAEKDLAGGSKQFKEIMNMFLNI